MPLAWGVANVDVVEDRAAAIAKITSEGFDPRAAVLLTREQYSDLRPGLPPREGYRATVVDQTPDRLRVETEFFGPGWLVISRRWDKGWIAEVDGKEAEVLRADGVLQAVEVPEGQHVVELRFRPKDYVWGQRISIATASLVLLAVVGYVAYGWSKRKGWKLEVGRWRFGA
jgi:hypothetical protein